ncbi:MAG: hypothetical protein E6G97_18545 [Alphaproteobacteria bacterium]|nr:MAG: hypothetical protein E6G97_18545 [Alphaproteobacteria bacterium]
MTFMMPNNLPDGTNTRIDPAFNLRFFWPSVAKRLMDVTAKELEAGTMSMTEARATAAFCGFAACCLDPNQGSPEQAAHSSGFLFFDKRIRDAVLARFGQIMTASLWWPLREGTLQGECPVDIKGLSRMSENLFNMLSGKVKP